MKTLLHEYEHLEGIVVDFQFRIDYFDPTEVSAGLEFEPLLRRAVVPTII